MDLSDGVRLGVSIPLFLDSCFPFETQTEVAAAKAQLNDYQLTPWDCKQFYSRKDFSLV